MKRNDTIGATIVFVLVALLVRVGPLEARNDTPNGKESSAPRCLRMSIEHAAEAPGSRGGETSFSATAVEDLRFSLYFLNDFEGEHVVSLELALPGPDEFLYRRIDVPVAEPASTPGARRLPGYPFPVEEVAPRREVDEQGHEVLVVNVTLPVAGTAIVSNSFYGEWSVTPFVDRAEAPCLPPTSFVITP